MISLRTRYSLAQFLALQATHVSTVLFTKHGASHIMVFPAQPLVGLTQVIDSADDVLLMSVIQEVVATTGDLRAPVSPKHRFDERWHDLTQCLLIDGYIIEGRSLIQADPSIADASPMEDDLITALKSSSLPRRDAIVSRINDSAEAFRRSEPDYNAALTNARVAIETLAGDVASAVAGEQPPLAPYDASSWGQVIGFLRRSGEITMEEEKGLAGVFGFLSAGAHRPMGVPENQMARLGRSFALNMCWFLLQNRAAGGS